MSKFALIILFPVLWRTGVAQQQDIVSSSPRHNQHFYNGSYVQPALSMQADTVPKTAAVNGVKKDDAFSKLMAAVVNDTAVLYNTYVEVLPVKDTVKTELVKKPAIKADSTVAKTASKGKTDSMQQKSIATSIGPPPKKDSVQAIVRKAFIQKMYEQQSDSALQMVYVVVSKQGKKDTINIIIPVEISANNSGAVMADTAKKISDAVTVLPVKKEPQPEPRKDTAVAGMPGKDSTVAIVIKEEKTNPPVAVSTKLADSNNNTKAVTPPAGSGKQPVTVATWPVVNTNCKNSATDYDVDKLRVKMLSMDNEDDKMLAAKKIFRVKCFTTSQVKALSEIFPTDEGRYKLFDTAYPFVSDYGNFQQLSSLLTGQYYINRFKAMLKP